MSDVIPIPLADISLEKRTDTITKEQPTAAVISGDTGKINSIKNIGVITGSYSTIQEAMTAHNLKLSTLDSTLFGEYPQASLIYLEDGNLQYIDFDSKEVTQGFDFKSGKIKNIFKNIDTGKYYIVNNDGIVEEYKLNSEDSNKKKKLIEEAIKDKEVLSKIYNEILDTTDEDENTITEDFISREDFTQLNSIEEISEKIEEILDTTVTEGDQPEGKYIDNILDYENCSINLV